MVSTESLPKEHKSHVYAQAIPTGFVATAWANFPPRGWRFYRDRGALEGNADFRRKTETSRSMERWDEACALVPYSLPGRCASSI